MAYAAATARKQSFKQSQLPLAVVQHIKPEPVIIIDKPKFHPTEEQVACGVLMGTGRKMKINAFAGTGKTSTLIYMSGLYDKVGEMWCFNKRNADEAQQKFDKRKTRCLTSHAKAYRELKIWEMGGKLDGKWPTWRIARELGVSACCGVSAEHVTYAALQSLRRFMYSADMELTIDHCWDGLRGRDWFMDQIIKNRIEKYSLELPEDFSDWTQRYLLEIVNNTFNAYRAELYRVSRDLWTAMWDVNHPLPLEHDAYLKAYQLTMPKLTGIDYLMVDEYQDTNPCVESIVNNQPHIQIVVVGDERQAIYGFRGSKNGMANFDSEERNLTLCHRCGPAITHAANVVLSHRYPDLPQIRGNQKIRSTLGPVDTSKPYTILSRSNAALFQEAVKVAANKQRLFVMGGLKDAVSRALSVYGVYVEDRDLVKHPEIKPYDDWKMIIKESEFDVELNRYVKLVKEHENDLPEICKTLEQAGECKDMKDADVVLATCHRSKGLEFKQVKLLNDFSFKVERDEESGRVVINGSDEEFNCEYIAVTRAIERLELNDIGHTMMEMAA